MEHKITKLGKINPEFDVFKLKSALTKNDAGDWGYEPIEGNANGILRSTNFTNQGILDLSDVAYRTLKPQKLAEKKLSAGEIIIERSGGSDTQPVGRIGFITPEIADNNYAFANFIQRIAVDETIEPKYLYYCLQQMYEMGITASMQYQTTGIRNLDWKLYTKSILPKPKPEEQKAIATILSKVDEAIKATENSIKAAEKLKKSLMQNLLTGKLKPDGTWRKEDEFTFDEKVGYYPNEWNCNRFKEFSVLQRGKDLTDNEVISGIFPVVKSNGTTIHHNEYICEPPGVVTGRSGTIGKVFFLEEKYWAHNTTLYVKDFKGNYEKYIFYLIQTMRFEKYFAGTTVPTLNRNDVHRVRVAIPKSVDEQKNICKLIDDVNQILKSKENKIIKLHQLKKALMQNLLTGKVRVDLSKIANILNEI